MNRRSKTSSTEPFKPSTVHVELMPPNACDMIAGPTHFEQAHDILGHMMTFCPAIDVLQCRRVSHRWRAAAEENDSYNGLLEKVRKEVRHYNQSVIHGWESIMLVSAWIFCLCFGVLHIPKVFVAVLGYFVSSTLEPDSFGQDLLVGLAIAGLNIGTVAAVAFACHRGRRALQLLRTLPPFRRPIVQGSVRLFLMLCFLGVILQGVLQITIKVEQLLREAPEIVAECADGNSSKASFVYVRFSQPQLWEVGQPLQLPDDGEASFVVLSFVPPAQEQYEKICGPNVRRSTQMGIVDTKVTVGGDPHFWEYFSRNDTVVITPEANASPKNKNGEIVQKRPGFVVAALYAKMRVGGSKNTLQKIRKRLQIWKQTSLFKEATLPILSMATGRYDKHISENVFWWLEVAHRYLFGFFSLITGLFLCRTLLFRRREKLQEPREPGWTAFLKRRLTRSTVSLLTLDLHEVRRRQGDAAESDWLIAV